MKRSLERRGCLPRQRVAHLFGVVAAALQFRVDAADAQLRVEPMAARAGRLLVVLAAAAAAVAARLLLVLFALLALAVPIPIPILATAAAPAAAVVAVAFLFLLPASPLRLLLLLLLAGLLLFGPVLFVLVFVCAERRRQGQQVQIMLG